MKNNNINDVLNQKNYFFHFYPLFHYIQDIFHFRLKYYYQVKIFFLELIYYFLIAKLIIIK